MRAYSNMTTAEFVAQLRDIAINAGARALVIDQIDALGEGSAEDEIAQLVSEAGEQAFKDGHAEGCKEMWDDIHTLMSDRLGPEEQYALDLLKECKP